ncbi:MAG: metal-dependent hydrolase [Moraxellaceae bacterium]
MPMDFEECWHQALGVKLQSRLTRSTLRSVLRRYREPQRSYHDLVHLDHILSLAQQQQWVHPKDSLLTLFYHDAIYDPLRQDNEQQSAHLAEAQLSCWLTDSRIARIKSWILATQQHLCPTNDPDLAQILDIDRAILAAEPSRYDAYAAQIRQEYAHIEDDLFRQHRTVFLNRMLCRPQLFYTTILGSEAEALARLNIQREIGLLKLTA